MNEFLQTNLIAIIIFLFLIILLLMGVLVFILIKLLLQQQRPINNNVVQAEIEKKPSLNYKDKYRPAEEPIVENHYCTKHPDAQSVGSCLICEDVFCDKCLVEHEGMHFCKDHFRTFASNKWKQITDVKTTPDTPEEGLYIYRFKRDLWSNKAIPSFVMTHYKINLENDYIESFIQLNVREADAAELSHEIAKFKTSLQ